MLNIGVVGAGRIAKRHIDNYKLLDNARVCAVCDVNYEAAVQAAKDAGADSFRSVEDMLAGSQIEAVDICAPTPLHPQLIELAAKAGKHIIVEKPLALTVAEAQASVDIANKCGVRLYVGQLLRWFPQYLNAREVLLSGSIGEPVIARSSRIVLGPSGWFSDHSLSGGVVLDVMIHDFDWFRWCFGEVKSIYAKGLYCKEGYKLDYALATLEFKNGVIGHIEGSWGRTDAPATDLDIAGTSGLYTYDNRLANTFTIASKDENDQPSHAQSAPVTHHPLYSELKDFVEGVLTGREFAITPADAVEAVRISECALKSITTGKPVEM